MTTKIKSLVTVFVGSPAGPVANPVTVTVTDGVTDSPISVYADTEGLGPLGNPFLSSGETIEFYCDAGLIDIDVNDGIDNIAYSDIRVGLHIDQFDEVAAADLDAATDKLLIYKTADRTFRHDLIMSINGAE